MSWRAALGIERAAAVAEAEVEAPVGPERELAAVVVRLGLVDEQQLAGLAAAPELGHAGVAALVAPAQVEAAVGGEVGVEGDPEQALFGAGRDPAGEVDHRRTAALVQADDAAGLLEHPERLWVAGSDADPGRPVQPGRDPLDVERVRVAALGGGARVVDAGQRVAQRARPRRRRRQARPRRR